MANMLSVSYKYQIIDDIYDRIDIDGFTSIEFENIGSQNAILQNIIPLPPNSYRKFENRSGEIIKEKFHITIPPYQVGAIKILVIKTYYH
jgi:hypothetical protein